MRFPVFVLFLSACFVTACALPRPDTQLTIAVDKGDLATVQELLAQGAQPDAPDRHGLTPLIRATRAGNRPILRALLDAGASPNQNDGYVNGWTPMMHAIHKNQPD